MSLLATEQKTLLTTLRQQPSIVELFSCNKFLKGFFRATNIKKYFAQILFISLENEKKSCLFWIGAFFPRNVSPKYGIG
jgi:hypothetical protein